MENSAVVWHPGLTKINTTEIERVQKSAFAIILGKEYNNYEHALHTLGRKRLSERRENLCLKFAMKSLKSEKFQSWFTMDSNPMNTRRKLKKSKRQILEQLGFKNQHSHI